MSDKTADPIDAIQDEKIRTALFLIRDRGYSNRKAAFEAGARWQAVSVVAPLVLGERLKWKRSYSKTISVDYERRLRLHVDTNVPAGTFYDVDRRADGSILLTPKLDARPK